MKLSKLQLSKKSHIPTGFVDLLVHLPTEQNLCLNFLNLLISLNDCFLLRAFLTQTSGEAFQP